MAKGYNPTEYMYSSARIRALENKIASKERLRHQIGRKKVNLKDGLEPLFRLLTGDVIHARIVNEVIDGNLLDPFTRLNYAVYALKVAKNQLRLRRRIAVCYLCL